MRDEDGSALISYGNNSTGTKAAANKEKFRELKAAARNDLRKFSSIRAQRKCCVAPLSYVRVTFKNGRFDHDKQIACKNRQSCPWCTPPNLAAQRTKIRAKGIHSIDMGGFALKADLTLPKRTAFDLAYSYKILREQMARYRRKVRQVEIRWGIPESARMTEETYSQSSGWHPHVSWVWYLHEKLSEDSLNVLKSQLLQAWLDSADDGQIRGVQVVAQEFNSYYTDAAVKKLSEYVSKHSFYIESIPKPSSSGTFEKLQPWEILNLARTGDVSWIKVWHKFEKAMKGHRRIIYYTNT